MKIYTKKGDSGETSLSGGQRTPKDDIRVAAYGTIDELCCSLGVVAARLRRDDPLRPDIVRVQHHLFRVGAELADPKGRTKNRPVGGEDIAWIESRIDFHEESLPELKRFILPGGGETGAALHLARAICRRAERKIVSLHRATDDAGVDLLAYVNRLSDFLFVLARSANRAEGVGEEEWDGEM